MKEKEARAKFRQVLKYNYTNFDDVTLYCMNFFIIFLFDFVCRDFFQKSVLMIDINF